MLQTHMGSCLIVDEHFNHRVSQDEEEIDSPEVGTHGPPTSAVRRGSTRRVVWVFVGKEAARRGASPVEHAPLYIC